MSIKSLMIKEVESQYTQEYIAKTFWNQNVAKVSKVTLIPYIKNSKKYSIAYININEWFDSEAAYNFIQRLNDSTKEARLVYMDDNWWPVEINTHNNGNINVGIFTVNFDTVYWKGFESDSNSECDEEELEEGEELEEEEELEEGEVERPIEGLKGDYYTVDEALQHIIELNDKLELFGDHPLTNAEYRLTIQLEKELAHFENELHIYEIANNSSNVTQRAIDLGSRDYIYSDCDVSSVMAYTDSIPEIYSTCDELCV